MALESHWQMLLLKNMSPVALSVTDGGGSWACTISVIDMHIYKPLWKLKKGIPVLLPLQSRNIVAHGCA